MGVYLARKQMGDVQQIQVVLDALRDRPGEILFISDRQLVTFGELHSIQMEPEYEKSS